MSRGPKPGIRPAAHSTAATVAAAWGRAAPAWLAELARICDDSSQAEIAGRLGYSPATLSALVNGRYQGDLDAIARAVEAKLFAAPVACPAAGDITLAACLEARRHVAAGNRSGAHRQRFARACPACNQVVKGGV
jgi:hypothetical protein